ncbi:glucose 1-dehydrogenase [Rhabdothermincola sediminis]|uniref:glucose 1-dehydrogenase n=1 Tax=Rhabdothermincola sediminis TaxID=2751370 RepID=UPI001AA09539|nr:glucose 1-dehydrogenase [Rhabdothermincola sediminis]
MGRLEGKVAIISGAARGQGAAEAELFVREGAQVVIGDILDDAGQRLAGRLGEAARFIHLDVTDEGSWREALALTLDDFGPPNVLVNNAGVVHFARIVDTELQDLRRVLDINLVGTFLGMKIVAPAMAAAGGGSIVNISSSSGIVGFPMVGAYVSSKWAVRGLTKTAAIELGAANIRVNSVHPGGVDTPMTRDPETTPLDAFEPFVRRLPLRRLGTVDDIAPLVLFLASDESSYCTGAEFVVDGGQTAGDPGLLDF